MIRFALLSLLSLTANVYAAESTVDIDTAAKLYQAAAMREQVRASLGAMPEHIRQLFAADSSAKLSEPQLAAVSAAAVRGFRIDVFEAPALQAFAEHLDAPTVTKSQAFLTSELGRRVVTADVALATLGETEGEAGGELKGAFTVAAAGGETKFDGLFDRDAAGDNGEEECAVVAARADVAGGRDATGRGSRDADAEGRHPAL